MNYLGKATRVRDIIDIGDAIETFIPFAKRLGWITRRLTGFVTSTMGSLAMSMITGPGPVPYRHTNPSKSEGRPIAIDWSHSRTGTLSYPPLPK